MTIDKLITERDRLHQKADMVWDWLAEQDRKPGGKDHPQYEHRTNVAISTMHAYERACDAIAARDVPSTTATGRSNAHGGR
jgi:hypothetical protein